MSSLSSACETIHVSPSFREHTRDPVGVILSQGGCLTHDQVQMFGNELGVLEMSEAEYTHFQQLVQMHMEAQAVPPHGQDARSHPAALIVKDAAGSTVISPLSNTQAIDLSTSTDEHCLVMPGEKTPTSYGEVPGVVLARVRSEDSLTEPRASGCTSSEKQSRSAARVCLEKRFNTIAGDTLRQQDIQSAVLSNFLTVLQPPAEAQEAVLHPQMQKWMKTDRANSFEGSSSLLGGVFNTVTNMYEQVIGYVPHMLEPKHQGLIIPKSLSLNIHSEGVVTKAHGTSGSNSTPEQQLVDLENVMATPAAASRKHGRTRSSQPFKAAKAGADSAQKLGGSARKKAKSHISLSQCRERHNSKERERRKRIRLCCDELNTLVPFCNSGSDKVTTLQWTTAFLRYINKTYGDTLKEEFQKAFSDEKELSLKSSPSSGYDPVKREMDETLSISLVVEQ